jgi:hypothetical protein
MDDRRNPMARWSWVAIVTGLVAHEARAQSPDPPAAGAPPAPVCTRRGRVHRMFHHVAHTVQDDFIGQPETFLEPPLGTYINRQFAIQVGKADPHRFTVYQSDFLPDTDQFSPVGASRFNLMYSRLAGWSGPILVEWTPDQPELAESRRRAILATLAAAGQPMPADRVLIGPSPYPGTLGLEPANNYNNTIGRSQTSAVNLTLPPAFSSSMGVR